MEPTPKKKTIKEIPDFKSYKEEATFWDTHCVLDYVDETERVNLILEEPSSKKDTTIRFTVDAEEKELLRKRAQKEETTVSALLRSWMHQKLTDSPR